MNSFQLQEKLPGGRTREAPKLLFLVPDSAFFVSHRLNLAAAACDRGYRVAVASPPDEAVADIVAARLEHLPINVARGSTNPLRELRAVASIASVLREFRPDLVHLVTSKAIIYGGLLARVAGIPALAAISGLGRVFVDDSRGARVRRWLVGRAYRIGVNGKLSHVIFQNEDDVQLFKSEGILLHDRHTLISGSGADLDQIVPTDLPEGETVLALPARLIRDKGVVEFAEAARILKRKGIPARFRLIGDPDPSNPTALSMSEIEAWAKEGIVEWRPHTRDIGAALAECHIVVLPSYREGFPKTLIDAAAAGRACAASDAPGCRHAILEGVTGVLFRPRAAGHMAEVLEPLILDRQRQIAMGKAARAHAKRNFDVCTVTSRHLQIYDEMAKLAGIATVGS